MKKRIIFFIALLFLLFPQRVKAISISGTTFRGDSKKKVGEQFTITYQIQFSGLEKGKDKTNGIWFIMFELTYDDSILKLKNFSAPNFETQTSTDIGSNKMAFFSEVIDNSSSNEYCANGFLFCNNYSIALTFEVRETSITSTSIDITDVKVGLLDITENRTYTEEDVILIEDQRTQTHNLTIVPITKTSNTNSNTVPSKSSNKFLKSLEIENYEIDFDRQKTDYTISVDRGVNTLKVKTTTEDSKATYRVIGSDDLSKNNNVIRIEVTAEDSTKKTYYIKVKFKDKEVTKEKVDVPEENVEPKKPIGKIFKWIGIGVGIFALLGMVAFVVSKVRDHAIDKKLEQLEED